MFSHRTEHDVSCCELVATRIVSDDTTVVLPFEKIFNGLMELL